MESGSCKESASFSQHWLADESSWREEHSAFQHPTAPEEFAHLSTSEAALLGTPGGRLHGLHANASVPPASLIEEAASSRQAESSPGVHLTATAARLHAHPGTTLRFPSTSCCKGLSGAGLRASRA